MEGHAHARWFVASCVAEQGTACCVVLEVDIRDFFGSVDHKLLQEIVRKVPVADHVIRYALSLVRQTRVGHPGAPDFVQDMVAWGAGPRAVQFLLLGGKARALLGGRTHVSTDDIQELAAPVLRHRIVTNFSAESEGITADHVVERLVKETPSKEGELTSDPRLQKIFAA